MKGPVLLVDDEPHLRNACSQSLQLAGYEVESFARAGDALDRLDRSWPGVIVSDVKMAGMSGLELLTRALDLDPELPIILITGHGDIPMAVEAIRSGAYDFIEKPFASEILVDAVRRALEKRYLVLENRQLRDELASGTALERRIAGRSPAIMRLRDEINAFAATDADVLILGDTGTGKELAARTLHELSPRSAGRFVPINCAALPDTIIESELFGHESGAFTGATKMRKGKFEFASGGTLFLDEIESMPLEMQTRLLRVLQERSIVRLGANDDIPIDVRVIAATKTDLREASAAGRFRQDLFYRLNVLHLTIPPLRERREDIPMLFAHFLIEAALRFKSEPAEPSPMEIAMLVAHDWPGNVRELQNTALRFALGFGVEIGAFDNKGPEIAEGGLLAGQLAFVERLIIQRTLALHNNSLKATYEALGISRKTLYDKMQKHGLTADDGAD